MVLQCVVLDEAPSLNVNTPFEALTVEYTVDAQLRREAIPTAK